MRAKITDIVCHQCGCVLQDLDHEGKCPECDAGIGEPPQVSRWSWGTVCTVWSGAVILLSIAGAVANIAFIGVFDRDDAVWIFMSAWGFIGAAALILLIMLALSRPAPMPMWIAAGGGLIVSLAACLANPLYWMLHQLHV